jgi:hypothetical protein
MKAIENCLIHPKKTYEVITISQKITVKDCINENDALKKIGMSEDVVIKIRLLV